MYIGAFLVDILDPSYRSKSQLLVTTSVSEDTIHQSLGRKMSECKILNIKGITVKFGGILRIFISLLSDYLLEV